MIWLYAGFVALVLGLLALDLGVFHRKVHVVSVKEALGWSAFWIGLGVAFAGVIYLGYDQQWLGLGTRIDGMSKPEVGPDGVVVFNDGASATIKYLTGFVVEKSLAVDNIFVIVMIFGFCGVPAIYQHRVLFWGILGALIMRGVMIGVGAVLITRFQWIVYLFGGFLVLTGLKMLRADGQPADLGNHPLVRWIRRVIPMTSHFHGARFWIRAGTPARRAPAAPGGVDEPDPSVEHARVGALLATPLLLALLMIEVSDVIFAVDSIPAIFAITTDPFLVFTSNIFAILGLRSLYFALAGMIDTFRYLKVALAVVLVVIGAKMLAHGWLEAWLGPSFNLIMLAVVGVLLAAGVIASVIVRRRERRATALSRP